LRRAHFRILDLKDFEKVIPFDVMAVIEGGGDVDTEFENYYGKPSNASRVLKGLTSTWDGIRPLFLFGSIGLALGLVAFYLVRKK
jgi:hypothetical protein